ncbi:LpqB family beta-propeller domain-containing protein [uncultured Jatrophihabitans sp.]|uniref:LpqB family beta-propeller domain-containing protein n=1 Tax=uncultured Jatrophihabitans sp. TaxID=1610747 RepID=UPI0035C9DDC2
MKRLLVILVGLTMLVTGCTGVPQSSAPAVVRSLALGGEEEPEPTVTPLPGVLPQNLVQTFLAENSADAGKHASARSFLTPAARSRWTDTSATIVSSISVGAYTPGKPIIVNAIELGTVSTDGVYTPGLQTGKAAAQQFSFGITKVGGQYRISSLRSGLILTEEQFENSFVARSIYFFDLAHRYLVPDARWTPDTDPIDTSEALINQLAAGPSPGLANAVSTDTLPAQAATPRHIDVTSGNPVKIEIAGASQLDVTSKNFLAAQIAATLSDIDRGRALEITDGGTPVRIPRAGGTNFAAADFVSDQIVQPSQQVYYLRAGQLVYGRTRRLVGGRLADSRYPLVAVAVSRSGPGGGLSIAGVTSVDGLLRLVMGSQSVGLRRTTVSGVTSRPAFAPGRADEAWVGAGTRIYRTVLSGTKITSFPVQLPSTVAGQQVMALRLSPEGSRIALVLRDSAGHQALWIGAVVRTSASQVSIGMPAQISPIGVKVTDLAWIEGERLNAIGYDAKSQDAHVYRTGADGSAWTEYGIGELPSPPTTLAGAPGAPAWASASSNVYLQASGTVWSNPPGGSGTATGTAPTYVE